MTCGCQKLPGVEMLVCLNCLYEFCGRLKVKLIECWEAPGPELRQADSVFELSFNVMDRNFPGRQDSQHRAPAPITWDWLRWWGLVIITRAGAVLGNINLKLDCLENEKRMWTIFLVNDNDIKILYSYRGCVTTTQFSRWLNFEPQQGKYWIY